jgi:hypothetical protein
MRTVAFVMIVSALPAWAQEPPAADSIFDALKTGDWVRYSTVATRDLLDLTVVEKPANTSIKRYREDLAKKRDEASAARTKYNEAMRELQTANIPLEERSAKLSALRKERDAILPFGASARGRPSVAPYEVKSIRQNSVVLSNGTQERFIARSAVRMIVRNLPAESAEADK